ncbi:MAG: Fe-S cluster assembly protein IscX [Anaerolineales bacterium]|nr:Fe-S cluster assembly protein IscX [Anaerolineales bacterium]
MPNINPLYWDSTYEIVLNLIGAYPELDPDQVGIQQLLEMVLALPNFADDPVLANEDLLVDILRVWYEEALFYDNPI